jgi:hypothetical protein
MMNFMNTEGSGRGLILGYYPGIRMEGLRRTTEDFSQDSQSLSRDLNPEPPEYEAGMLSQSTTTFGAITIYNCFTS